MKDRALVAVVVVTLGSVLSVCQGAAKVQHRDNTWVLENERLEVEVHAPSGRISVRDKNAAYTWRQPTARAAAATDRFRNVERLPGPQHGISFETNVTTRGSRTLRLNVKMTVPEVNADVIFEVDATARHVPIDSFVCFDPLVLDAPKACLALSAHGDGLLIDATDMSWRGRRYSFYGGPRLDMPWIGLTDMSKGYICLMETADDGAIVLRDVLAGGRKTLAPQVRWRDSKGAFRYPRKWRYRFCATGGYVALAKSY
nr:hypothetical protein [PVC group bacterium]